MFANRAHFLTKTINNNRPAESIFRAPMDRFLFIRHRAQQLELHPPTLWNILRKDLGLGALKILLVQEMKPNDNQERQAFCEWAQHEMATDPDFHKTILFSDEAHYWLNGSEDKKSSLRDIHMYLENYHP